MALQMKLITFPSGINVKNANSIRIFNKASFTDVSNHQGETAVKKETIMKKKIPRPPNNRNLHQHQATHTTPAEKLEIFKSLEGWARTNILTLLSPVEQSWQPQDLLPSPQNKEQFQESIAQLRERCEGLPDDYLVVLVGDMITEEAIPTYQSLLNTMDGVRDETASSTSVWATWIRAWSSEENRHGDLLNKYLYLSGRVDMKSVEKTVQYLIASGVDPQFENSPYLGFIYTSFQERATSISHGNTARLAKNHGDITLAKICGTIAADEKRHETAYIKIVEKLFEVDPDTTMLAFADMMKTKVVMPAHMMYDGRDENLFEHFSAVAQRLGVYTMHDYANIVEFLVNRWKVEKITLGLSSEGRRAQDYLCGLASRIRRLEERAIIMKAKRLCFDDGNVVPFSWVFDRGIKI